MTTQLHRYTCLGVLGDWRAFRALPVATGSSFPAHSFHFLWVQYIYDQLSRPSARNHASFLSVSDYESVSRASAEPSDPSPPCRRPSKADPPLTSLVTLLPGPQALKPGAATQLDAATLETVAGDAPSAVLPRAAVAGVPVADVMVAVKLQPSKSAARK